MGQISPVSPEGRAVRAEDGITPDDVHPAVRLPTRLWQVFRRATIGVFSASVIPAARAHGTALSRQSAS